jgi:hypothetical protein
MSPQRGKLGLVLVNGQQERRPESQKGHITWNGTIAAGGSACLSARTQRMLQPDASERRPNSTRSATALPFYRRTGKTGPRSIARAVAQFLEETELTKKPKTSAAYTTALNYFVESCHRPYLQDVERKDLLKFSTFLRDEKKQAPRSVYNKFENVMTFLKANGIRGLVGKNDWPRYTEEEPEIYEQEELAQLFAACDANSVSGTSSS